MGAEILRLQALFTAKNAKNPPRRARRVAAPLNILAIFKSLAYVPL
jgi:hypothetical protein